MSHSTTEQKGDDVWNPVRWRQEFESASQGADRDALRRLRADVFRGTVEAVRARGYDVDEEWVSLDEDDHYETLVQETVFYADTSSTDVPEERRRTHVTQVDVVDADCLTVAHELGESGDVAAVLNMASRWNPGGGVLSGAGAQEENLFRRSVLLHSLYQFMPYAADYDVPQNPEGRCYPIPRDSGGIYSPPTAIFRSCEASGYALLPRPYRAAFITVPAISNPDVIEAGGHLWLTEAMAEATRTKIRGILRIGARHDHADLVLSAFGCGAFRNPPQHIARLFRETLAEAEFEGVFRRIAFAVIDDHNAGHQHNPEGNFIPFARELQTG